MEFFYLTKQLAYGGEAIGKDKLTPKQLAFADYYIELGNATEAAIKAGYSQKTAKEIGAQNLTKLNIKSYIDERMEQISSNRIASATEVMETLTSILRGEATAATLRGVGEGAQVIDEDMPPTMAERIKAAELIGKRFAMWTDKQEISGTVTPIFVDDIRGDGK